MASRVVIPVHEGWSFKQADEDDTHWLPASQLPTNVHLDLLAHKRIPDPFSGKNEQQVQWIGERRWVYKTSFPSPDCIGGDAHAVLAFDGLDTFATVELNGKTILESDNMFLPQRVDVTDVLAPAAGKTNTLSITFDSAYLRGWKLVEEHPDHKWGCWNGDISRLAVRKAQYHWGWDWGPTLLTCGPWKPIHLEVYESRISDLYFETSIDDSLQSATVVAHTDIEQVEGTETEMSRTATTVRFDVFLGDTTVVSETVGVDSASSSASATFHIAKPALWYPVRYGRQSLYTVKATLLHHSNTVDTESKKIGLRRIELVQEKLADQPGKSFFFRVNNTPIFCGGSNWIPADNFLERITPQKYHDWVQLVADGNQCMLRIWGGGIYENEALYDACDELGVLVWQDFMFGCGNYPAWPAMLESIRREAEANVRRMRHHASIAIWAGNNEDYQYRETEKLTYDYTNKDADSWLKTDFPARYIYEKILADVCAELIPDTAYHFGSPWGNNGDVVDTRDRTVGDLHQWDVWHGTQERYQDFDKLVGRFVSEFGMEALPHPRTVDAMLPLGRNDPDRYAQSSTLDWHNKAAGQERRLALYLVENMRYGPDPLDEYIHRTQLMQAECLSSAYRLWRRQWKGADVGRAYCSGALVWQINDCWPTTSWSICDYYLRPKHAYYAIKRAMQPLTVGMARKTHTHSTGNRHSRVDAERITQLDVWASSLLVEAGSVEVECVLRGWDVTSGKSVALPRDDSDENTTWTADASGHGLRTTVRLASNQSTEIAVFKAPEAAWENVVVAAYLVDAGDNDRQLARYINWPEPLKYLHLATPSRLTARLSQDGDAVELQADVPVKGLAVEGENIDGDDNDGDEKGSVSFDDNLVDLVPDEIVRIGVHGATTSTVWRLQHL